MGLVEESGGCPQGRWNRSGMTADRRARIVPQAGPCRDVPVGLRGGPRLLTVRSWSFQFLRPSSPGSRSPLDSSLKCLWMMAGVVDYRLCAREYDCDGCPFDRAVHGGASAGGLGHAPEAGHAHPTRGVRAADSSSEAHFPSGPGVGGVPREILPSDIFYDHRHLWGRVEADARVRVGLGAFAQKLLGRVYAIRLPEPGTHVSAREACWFVAHRSGETSLGVPVDGIVCDVNERLLAEPSLLHRDPYGLGYVLCIEPTNLVEDLRRLAYGASARTIESRDTELLGRLVSEASGGGSAGLGPTLADGGELVADPLRDLAVEQVERLIVAFLSVPPRERSGSIESPLSPPAWPGGRRKGV
jgi:glycine cleavage system H protein